MAEEEKNQIENISLDGDWDFAYTPEIGTVQCPQIPEEFTIKMPVPGYWDDYTERMQISGFWSETAKFNPDFRHISFPMGCDMPPDASLPYLVGVGWYKRTINIPVDWSERQFRLTVGGVILEAWVWVNKKLVEYHMGHSTPFDIFISKEIILGEANEIIIAVSNIRKDRLGCVIRGYKGFSAGIYRSVQLKVTGKLSICDCYVYKAPNAEKLNWNVNLEGEIDSETKIKWHIKDPQKNFILSQGVIPVNQSCLQWTTDASRLKPWSEHSPKLYEISLHLVKGEYLLDTHTQSFGLRFPESKGHSLYLNGRPMFLRGATEHAYFPLTCTPPKDINAYRSMIHKLKELGFNWLRFHTWVPSEEYLCAADELGMMIQVEPPLGFEQQEWIDILYACRKHPSVIVYCCGNEEFIDEEKIDQLRNLANLCHTLIPDALFNPQEAMRGIEYYFVNSDDEANCIKEPFMHNPVRLEAVREFSDVFGQYPSGLLSYTSTQGDWRELNKRLEIYERPCLSHEVGIHGSYLNIDLEHRYAGTRIGTQMFASVRQNLNKEGILSRAPTYYKNSCSWMKILRKQAIENARKCTYSAGYDFLGAIDYHWHRSGYPCGIMNEFYELKPGESAEDVLKYNGESVLLLDHPTNRNLSCSQSLTLKLFSSLYGENILKSGIVSWYLADSQQHIYQRGQSQVMDIQNGKVEKLTDITFTAPNLEQASKIVLYVNLSGGEYEISNSWDFWVFPKQEDSDILKNAVSNIKIVSELDEVAMDFLAHGGKVVLIGNKPFPTLPTTFQISVAGRVQGNLATVIEGHPITNRFPHEGFCDWQFYNMIEGGNTVVFNEINIPFQPIIEMVSTFKLIRKQASLFELCVGKGKLLVCTLNLTETDPAAMYLLSVMIDYVNSMDFKPQTAISVDEILQLMGVESNLKYNFATDEALDPNVRKTFRNK